MKNFRIISDSSCDLTDELAAEYNIQIVPFYVSFDGENYYKEKTELPVEEFYNKMVNEPNVFPKSSLPGVQDYIDCFLPLVQEHTAIICMCITTKFSGSYNSARTAADAVREEYPEAQITVIDTCVNTVLQGALVLEAGRMQRCGADYEDVIAAVEDIKASGRIFFTIGNIDYLKHGGRIGKLAGLAASTLGIRPLIQLKEGEIFSCGLSRNRAKSMTKVIDNIVEHFNKISDQPENYSLVIGYGHDYEEALAFRHELVTRLCPVINENDIPMFRIGAAIAVHTGPAAIGAAFVRRYDAPAAAGAPAKKSLLSSLTVGHQNNAAEYRA